MLSVWDLVWVFWFHLLHYWSLAPIDRLMSLAFKPFKDIPVEDVEREMATLVEQRAVPQLYPEMIELLREHKEQGDIVYLLSASSVYLIKPLAKHLDVAYMATTPIEAGGYFTGELCTPVPYESGKAVLAERLAEKLGVSLSGAYFYSDSFSDRFLLEKVGFPVCVNPDIRLQWMARTRGWEVLRPQLLVLG